MGSIGAADRVFLLSFTRPAVEHGAPFFRQCEPPDGVALD